jgi:hypothetical protein
MADVLEFQPRWHVESVGPGLPQVDWDPPLFIDWLTLRQVHQGGGLRVFTAGYLTSCDADGVVEYELLRREDVEGSYDSRCFIRCDGSVVEFHGNPGRYGRRDNVFGYGWSETVRRVNELLAGHFLPPFTAGELLRYSDSGWQWTGARVSRIDVTMNYAAFSERDAQALLLKLGQHHAGRQRGTVMPDQSTVTFGYGSRYASGKVYLKHVELERHRRTKHGAHVEDEVVEFCRSVGMLREELTLKSRFLTQQGLAWLGAISQQRLMETFIHRSQLRRLREIDMNVTDTSALTAGARGTLARWEQGEPHGLKRATFYRHRREILAAVGVDISAPRNVQQLKQPTRVVEIAALVAPDWYRQKYG